MASNEPLYLPIRAGEAEPVDEDGAKPSTTAPSSSDSSNIEEEIQDHPQPLQRMTTSNSAREREFQPIAVGDRDELHRIASNFASGSLTRTSTKASGIERRDTLHNVNIGDPVLDPSSPEFDPYKWSRMYVQISFCFI